MPLSAFQVDRGQTSGRLPSATAADGAYAFELGSSVLAAEAFEVNNYIEVSQVVAYDFAVQKLLRFKVRLRAPVVGAAGVAWELVGRVNTSIFYRRYIQADGREVQINSAALSLRLAPAPPSTVTVRFRLTLALYTPPA